MNPKSDQRLKEFVDNRLEAKTVECCTNFQYLGVIRIKIKRITLSWRLERPEKKIREILAILTDMYCI